MTNQNHTRADVIIIGGGLAGIAAAIELLDQDKSVLLLERGSPDGFGGLARDSFGGIFLVDTPQQRRGGISDSPELAYSDWLATARFDPTDIWPRRWAEQYVEHTRVMVHDWLRESGLKFLPVVGWAERGLFHPGNSVPRFHIVWGIGKTMMDFLIARLRNHKRAEKCRVLFDHFVDGLEYENKAVTGCRGKVLSDDSRFRVTGDAVIIASGGIMGDLNLVRKHWPRNLGAPPETILNGSHETADGSMHGPVRRLKGKITHLDRMWTYASGVHHPNPRRPDHGLTIIPAKSGVWVNHQGHRMGPVPLVTAYDTRYLVEKICEQKKKYSWQVLNYKIAVKELAIQGSEYNVAMRDRKLFSFIKGMLLGQHALVRDFAEACVDFVTADSLPELVAKMNAVDGHNDMRLDILEPELQSFDAQIKRGPRYFNDDQLRRIAQARRYRGDRIRTCNFQEILDPRAGPLMAIRFFILSRKSMGGIQTDLSCRVLSENEKPISGLYAVGEAAGFGGGGIHGWGALEGTFLGNCIFTGRRAARAVAGD